MLLSFPEFYNSETEQFAVETVKAAVDFMLSLESRSHNFAPSMDEVGSSSRAESDELVHWCHGAPGCLPIIFNCFLLIIFYMLLSVVLHEESSESS